MTRHTTGLAALTLALIAAPLSAQRPDSAMLGSWEGSARITVDWTQRKELSVRIAIHDDGIVAGTIGDATLTEGRLSDNRGIIARSLRLGPQWVIDGRLSGFVIHAEDIRRESVRLSLGWTGSTFEGTLSTSGSEDGRKESMKLVASGLVLRRAMPVVSMIR